MKKGGLKGPLNAATVRAAFDSELAAFVAKNSRAPEGTREWEALGLVPSRKTIANHLKVSVNDLLTEAGYATSHRAAGCRPIGNPLSVREMAYSSIRAFMNSHDGRPPGSREWEKLKLRPSRVTIRHRLDLSINAVLTELGFDPVHPARPNYTGEQLLAFIHRYVDEFGEPPTVDDLKADRPEGYPSFLAYYNHFDSFEAALKLAIPGFDGNRGYTKAYLVQRIRDFVTEFQRTPYPYELDGKKRPKGYPTGRTYDRAFGSEGVNECLRELGLRFAELPATPWPPDRVLAVTKSIVLDYVRQNGRPPTTVEWNERKFVPTIQLMRSKLELTYNEVLVRIGFTPAARSPNSYTDDELLQFMRDYYDEFEREPTADGFRSHSNRYPDPINYVRRFNSWDQAVRIAGFESNKWLSPEFLKAEIHRFIAEHKRPPTNNEIKFAKGYPCDKAYKRIWGTVANCLVQMGITPPACTLKNAFGTKVLAGDRHLCDSREEAFVDDFLAKHAIHHERNTAYPRHDLWNKHGMKRCDFRITAADGEPVYVEYAGLITNKAYKEKISLKMSLADDMAIKQLIIYPWQLGQLERVFAARLDRLEA